MEKWTVTGTLNGSNWEQDFPLIATDEQDLHSEEIFHLHQGDSFKVRKNLGWEESYPAMNYTVDTDGEYRLCFNTETKQITLLAAPSSVENTPTESTSEIISEETATVEAAPTADSCFSIDISVQELKRLAIGAAAALVAIGLIASLSSKKKKK